MSNVVHCPRTRALSRRGGVRAARRPRAARHGRAVDRRAHLHGPDARLGRPTRLAAVPEFWRFRAIEVPVWSPDDAVSATIGLSTIVGIQEDKHVCGNCLAGLSDDEITYGRLQRVLGARDL